MVPVVGAIAAGNTVILKVSTTTKHTYMYKLTHVNIALGDCTPHCRSSYRVDSKVPRQPLLSRGQWCRG